MKLGNTVPHDAIKPQYESMHDWEFYAADLMTEYRQSLEEGLDVEAYGEIFAAIARLPKNEIKKKLGDVLFEAVANAPQKQGYPYVEPSDLASIRALRIPHPVAAKSKSVSQESMVRGAWLGRICGCLLGKSLEGIRSNELIPFLIETDNYPMHRYVLRSDLNDDLLKKYKFAFAKRKYADETEGMPPDDDTNYTVMAQRLLDRYGRDFTPLDLSRLWLSSQEKNAYCTAERVAYCNFIKGYLPPSSAIYQNPYREWIGAQIRGDYFGYVNPGDPEAAAEMAFRDASISHIKNGIYGEMWVSAMLAAAAVTDDIQEILWAGLGEIPHTSRLYESIADVINGYCKGRTQKECFDGIRRAYDEHTAHGWCHTIPNAMIVAAALLYGEGSYTRSVCMAVENAFDTDCNGATVGSVLGMAYGDVCIGEEWTKPIGDRLHTTLFDVGTVSIRECAQKTLLHIRQKDEKTEGSSQA